MVKKPFKTAIIEFYKLNLKKGKEYMVKHFKKSVYRATIYRWIKKYETTENCYQKYGFGTGKATEFMLQIKMDYKAFWSSEKNCLNNFLTQFCQKIE